MYLSNLLIYEPVHSNNPVIFTVQQERFYGEETAINITF